MLSIQWTRDTGARPGCCASDAASRISLGPGEGQRAGPPAAHGQSTSGSRSSGAGRRSPRVSARPLATIRSPPVVFETSISHRRGRAFDERDRAESVPVCLVNEALVRRLLPGRSPLGMRLAIRPASAPRANPIVREIVGVVRQVKGRPDETVDFLQIYVPLSQNTVSRHLPTRPPFATALRWRLWSVLVPKERQDRSRRQEHD